MFNEQLEAFDKFKKLKVGALFMQMGTGKTKVALELVKYNKVDYLIYLCPFSSQNNIQIEIIKWGINCPFYLAGYETIQSSDRIYLNILNKLDNYKNIFIIADESIFIKNDETKRFKRLLELRKKCNYALILNGTPLTNNEWDLYNQMYFLSPLIINMNRNQFNSTFFTEIKYKRKGDREKTFYKFSEVNANYLYKLINPYIFKCDLDFKLNEKEEYKFIDIDLKDYYLKKEDCLKYYKDNQTSETIILMLNSLNIVVSKNKSKLDKVIDYIKDKQVICYCNYLDEIDYIESKINCYVITGSVKNRSDIIKKFERGDVPLIMTFGVGSYSLNLQFCNEVVYSSINFDYGLMEQSKYRIKRIGQERDIKYTYILSNAKITDLVLDNIKRKKHLKNLIEEKIERGVLEEWVKNL